MNDAKPNKMREPDMQALERMILQPEQRAPQPAQKSPEPYDPYKDPRTIIDEPEPVVPYAPGSRPNESRPNESKLNEIGRMSAEAVLSQYEAAARAVEEMGEAVKERVKGLAAAFLECEGDMNDIAETAKSIREKGHHVRVQIEEASALSNDIRSTCLEFKNKVGL
jgi:hypothetical protein